MSKLGDTKEVFKAAFEHGIPVKRTQNQHGTQWTYADGTGYWDDSKDARKSTKKSTKNPINIPNSTKK